MACFLRTQRVTLERLAECGGRTDLLLEDDDDRQNIEPDVL